MFIARKRTCPNQPRKKMGRKRTMITMTKLTKKSPILKKMSQRNLNKPKIIVMKI